MVPKRFMIIAGETSGDALAAELVEALKLGFRTRQPPPSRDFQPLTANLAPDFFGAGGSRMAAAGVEVAVDLAAHAVVGVSDVLKKYQTFRRLFKQLVRMARERQPDLIILVDFSGFNLRFARAIQRQVRARRGSFHNWRPKLVYYVSPQVWASRPGRAFSIAENIDLVLSIFPFEKAWYAARVPRLRVEFVGHPMINRFRSQAVRLVGAGSVAENHSPLVLLLPGSRERELKEHLPVMILAARRLEANRPVRIRMVLPDENLIRMARPFLTQLPNLQLQVGGLPESLAEARLAIAATGTVTMECAFFGVPTVAIYKASWLSYWIGRNIVHVKYLAMPNLLANEMVFPEFIQAAATYENIVREAIDLLTSDSRRAAVKGRLAGLIKSLGPPGAAERAAEAILNLLAIYRAPEIPTGALQSWP